MPIREPPFSTPGSRRPSREDATRGGLRRSSATARPVRDAATDVEPMNDWIKHRLSSPGAALREADPEIAALIEAETRRQRDGLELIASENFVSPAVLEAMG